uniref:Uncharacterized protein n=1 Tax=Oryza nivara TaxID=4536 RepID=A0A0E0G1G5_ORYNI
MESMSWASESIRRSERAAPRRGAGSLEESDTKAMDFKFPILFVGEVNLSKLSRETVAPESKGRTFTYSRGDVATELVVPKIKNSKRCRAAAEGGRSPLRRLKLTSRTTMLPEDINSAGRPPDRELYDRLRRDKLVMPSHTQQSVPFCHDMAMPPSCDSSAMNRRRELFSCSTQAMAEVATARSSSNNAAVARPEEGIASLLLHGECCAICMNSLIGAAFGVICGNLEAKIPAATFSPTMSDGLGKRELPAKREGGAAASSGSLEVSHVFFPLLICAVARKGGNPPESKPPQPADEQLAQINRVDIGVVNLGKLTRQLVSPEVDEITWERPSDVVGISLEKSKGRTFTYSRGDVATELVVPKIKNSKRWRIAAEGGRSPLRRLKLTSRTTMLPEDISSAGRPPDRELYDRLRRNKLVMPSHTQQFVPFCHDMAMPPSCDSSARNRRRELFCSTQAMAEVATMRSSSNNAAVARPEYGIASLLLHGECGVICMNSLIPAICIVEVPVFPIGSSKTFGGTLSDFSIGISTKADGISPERLLFEMSIWNKKFRLLIQSAKDGALAQNEVGICPVNLLLLALSTTRLFILSHVVDGKFPVNKLLEMFNTCSGRSGVEDGSSLSPPVK